MVEPTEELEPLFDYKRVQPFAAVSLDDDDKSGSSPAPAAKWKKDEDEQDEDDVKVTKVVNHEVENDEDDWLLPLPKVSVDFQNQLGEDSTIKELRLIRFHPILCICLVDGCLFTQVDMLGEYILKKQELELEALRRPAGDILREVEESLRMELGNSLHDSSEVCVKQAPKPGCERPKIVISIQNKEGTLQFRVFKDDELEQIFKRYAEKVKCDVRSLVFFFDGDKIGQKATPESLGMEDDDIIEVHTKGL